MERKIYLYTNEILALQAGKDIPPVTCEIDLSNKCMLECQFCMYAAYRKDEGVDLPLDLYKQLLDSLEKLGTRSITFTGGGEPLSNPDTEEILDLAVKRSFDVGLITNGVLLHTIPDYLINSFKFIRISIDAASAETYEKIKGVNCFGRVVKNIERLLDLRERQGSKLPTIGLSYVVNKINEKEISKAKELSKKLGTNYIQFKPAWKDGSTYIFKVTDDAGVYVTDRYTADDTLPCTIAGLVGIVGANGKLYYCCQHRGKKHYELGDLREADFEEIWKRRKNVKPLLPECPQCRYMNYASRFKNIPEMLIEHRNFL